MAKRFFINEHGNRKTNEKPHRRRYRRKVGRKKEEGAGVEPEPGGARCGARREFERSRGTIGVGGTKRGKRERGDQRFPKVRRKRGSMVAVNL